MTELVGSKAIPRVVRAHRSSGSEHDCHGDQDDRPEWQRRSERQSDRDQRFTYPHRHGHDNGQDHHPKIRQLQPGVPLISRGGAVRLASSELIDVCTSAHVRQPRP